MAFWNKFFGIDNEANNSSLEQIRSRVDPAKWAFVDVEVGINDKRIHDIGALRFDGATFHEASEHNLNKFLSSIDFVCGHNIINHDAKYLGALTTKRQILVDTLYMSPLLLSERTDHQLGKEDKLSADHINNPVNDCQKAKNLLFEEKTKWDNLPLTKKAAFTALLHDKHEFKGFLLFVSAQTPKQKASELIREAWHGTICENVDLEMLVHDMPCELAFALAFIDATNQRSSTPGWVLHNFPNTEHVIHLLRNNRCAKGCEYCRRQLDAKSNLKRFFGFDNFRTYNGEPLQENAIEAAIQGKSLISIFPTGGGKSLTFQLPALISGSTEHGLTVVISPLQSLMKDQVDNLAVRGIADAETINGLLDPIARANAIQRVQNGDASILYIAPEMLRSKTVERILLARNVVRFVIDEAHCFSSWGQDFRVDYLYIGEFIRNYQASKHSLRPIPISCFTATAKQKVIQDIRDYFQDKLGVHLELFATSATRTNLHYSVIHVDTDDDKYSRLRSLLEGFDCPTIVYVSRTKRTHELASKLTRDGHKALPFNGKMSSDEKVANQEAFMSDKVRVIVATSAFGMGVDKSDVGLVVHYDISDSLENYVQEAGRAGRNPELNARCYVLYCDDDLDKHFILLNQTKLSISEIQQVWKAIKDMTKQRPHISCSALEIARQAGWDDSVSDIETRVRTALSVLEQSGYVKRGTNVPHVYATGITVNNMNEARMRITNSMLFDKSEVEHAVRIIKSLITEKHLAKAQNAEAESRVDYLADILGLQKSVVISVVERMRQEGILADTKDITAYLNNDETEKKSRALLDRFAKLEEYILNKTTLDETNISYRQLNDSAVKDGLKTSTDKDIRTLLYFLSLKGYIKKKHDSDNTLSITSLFDKDIKMSKFAKRIEICRSVVEMMYQYATQMSDEEKANHAINFSVVKLLCDVQTQMAQSLFGNQYEINLEDIEESLLYLSKIGVLKLEGGFLVLYNAMNIQRLKERNLKYKKDDYRTLDNFYKQKIQQIHIVGEYTNLMVRDYQAALIYVSDYFQMDYKKFIAKYFKDERADEIQRNLTPHKYNSIYSSLSQRQKEIIYDKESRAIVVAAGPGSGKTRVLVHKLASILQLEDVKHEQLLMLTFSRAAATEFKQRLMQLIGGAAHFVEIKTFHSYCFGLLGLMGNIDEVDNVVQRAAQMIRDDKVEQNKISKTVLVIDEAQDMSNDEFELVKALIENNEELRVIAVGDDDQNIFKFRGSDSNYMATLARMPGGRFIEMADNYRSTKHVVTTANQFVSNIPNRLKHTPINAVRANEGWVQITHHNTSIMYHPLVNSLLQNRRGENTCVLTQTNEEALIMTSLLLRNGVQAKLIQETKKDFCLLNLAEMRFFLRQINNSLNGAVVVTDELWEKAKEKTFFQYQQSTCLPYVKQCIKQFKAINKTVYISDFKEFVFESKIGDFCDTSDADVVVSTIHRSKGREFHDVYLMISDKSSKNDELLRCYYVGMTRAKDRLFIHTNSDLFDRLQADLHKVDNQNYSLPDEIVLQLSHKKVFLDFFKGKKSEILSLQSGVSLAPHGYALRNPSTGNTIVRFSNKMISDLEDWKKRGYYIAEATVRFIVAWKAKNAPKEEEETAVLLPELVLRQSKRN